MHFRFFLACLAAAAVSLPSQAAPPSAIVTTIAGQPGVPGYWDGPQADALFTHPTWLDVVSSGAPQDYCQITYGGNHGYCDVFLRGDIYVIDRINQVLRRISPNGNVTTVSLDMTNPYTEQIVAPNFGSAFGGGILIEPSGAGCGSGAYGPGMFIAGTGSQQVVLFSALGGLGLRDGPIVLGDPGHAGSADGPLGTFSSPTGIGRSWNYTGSVAIEKQSQWLYIADSGNDTIRRTGFVLSFEACPQNRVVETFAGTAGQRGMADGKGSAARFNTPRGVVGAPDGSVYVTDSGNHTIRRIAPDGTVTTVAGEGGVAGSNDGPALQAHFNTPAGIDVDKDGNVFIVDTFNDTIRELTKDGNVTTIAGQPGVSGFADGEHALFNAPVGLKIAPDGSLIVADTGNNIIRRVVFDTTK